MIEAPDLRFLETDAETHVKIMSLGDGVANASACGAGAEGDEGFQPDNTCADGEGGGVATAGRSGVRDPATANPNELSRVTIKPGVYRVQGQDGSTYSVKDRSAIAGGPEMEVKVSALAQEFGVAMPQSQLVGKELRTPWVDAPPLVKMTAEQRRSALKSVPKDDIDRTALFDYAVAHGDTHNGNYIVQGGRLHSIDKEMSLSVGGLGRTTHYEYPRFLDDVDPGGAGLNHKFDRATVKDVAARAKAAATRMTGADARTMRDRAKILEELARADNPTAGELWKLGKRGVSGGILSRLFGGG